MPFFGTYIADYISPRGKWKNIDQSFSDGPNLLPKVVELQSLINKVILPLFPKDKFFWMKNHTRAFSVKYTYHMLLKFDGDENCWKKVWNPQLI